MTAILRIIEIVSAFTVAVYLVGRVIAPIWKHVRLRFLPVVVLCMLPSLAAAANHYIRDGGTGTGTDWSDACDDFAGSCAVASLVRGDTYYVADGSYAARTFNKAASSNLVITIKKATVADHGTSTGWDNAYGDGQATFSSPLTFSSDDWVLDGTTRDESNPPLSWFTTTAYGFKISNNANAAQRQVIFGDTLDNFTMKYVWAEGRTGAFSGAERRYSIDTETGGTSTNITFSRNLTTDSNQWYFLRGTNNTTIEYWAGDRLTGDEFNHGDAINCYFTADNVTIRWGIARDACTEGCTGMIPIADAIGSSTKPTVLIYGNLFYDYGSTDGTAGFLGNASNEGSCTNCVVRNNTFVDGGAQFAANWGLQFGAGSGNVNQNNIWFEVNSQTPSFDLGTSSTNNYNLCGTSATCTGTNAQVSVATTKFVDFAGKNFKLASATDCGAAVSAPYDVDMLGNTRGADGCVDRGAFEYGTASPSTLAIFLSSVGWAELLPIAGLLWHMRKALLAGTLAMMGAVSMSASLHLPYVQKTVYTAKHATAKAIMAVLPKKGLK